PCSRCELDLDRPKADKTTSRRSLAGNLHRRKTSRCRRAHLPSPAKELTWMNPGLSGYCRHTGSRFQRRCDQLLLLRETPAPPPLNRCDDLNLPIRHVTIPMNTHMPHTSPNPQGGRYRRVTKDTLDLRISTGGIRRWVLHYRAPVHRCCDC